MPSQADRSRARSKASVRPTEAMSAEAMIAPNPGIVTSLRASSFSADELGVESRDPSIEFGPLLPGIGNEQSHPLAQSRSALFVHQHGQELFKFPLALRRDHSAFQQDGEKLIDQSCPLANQPVSGSMQGLHVQLILAL